MENIFEFQDYREAVKSSVRQSSGQRGYQKAIAKAAGCQASYLSKVLSGGAQLTPDHGAGIAAFWNLDSLSTQYFLEIIHLDRAGTKSLRKIIRKRLADLQKENFDLNKRFSLQPHQQDSSYYYSAWYISAIHVATSLKGGISANTISERLGVSVAVVSEVLNELAKQGFAAQKGPLWMIQRGSVHIDKGSPQAWQHLSSWRNKAIINAGSPDYEGVHFTNIISLSKRDLLHLRALLTNYIGESNSLVANSPEETIACLNIDLFEL